MKNSTARVAFRLFSQSDLTEGACWKTILPLFVPNHPVLSSSAGLFYQRRQPSSARRLCRRRSRA